MMVERRSRLKKIAGFGAFLFGVSLAAHAQTQLPVAKWTAVSTTAMGITGDVRTAPGSLTMHGSRVLLRAEQPLDATSLAVAAKMFSLPSAEGTSGSIYAVRVPANRRIKNRNTLCGKSTTTFAVVLLSPPAYGDPAPVLNLAFFSGADAPDLHTDAYKNSTALCGTLGYVKAGR